MKFTQIAADTFSKLQLNAGVLLTDFDPATGALDLDNIFGATGGGVNFSAAPEFIDFGEDIDNVPANTKELKRIDSITATMSGTFKAADTAIARALIGAADVNSGTGKVTPRIDLLLTDFGDIWWVGDYSDVNTGDSAGFMAIHLFNALSTGGFSIQSNNKGKGDFAFTFTGHFSINDISTVPYELYIKEGTSSTADCTLSSLAISSLTLTPTFASGTNEYSTTTTASSDTVDIALTDSTNAKAVITVNGNSIADGGTATWATGRNKVEIVVSNGGKTNKYKVTVTKS